jgi:hypothetical protein
VPAGFDAPLIRASPSTTTPLGFDDREMNDQTRGDGDSGADQSVVAVGEEHGDPVPERCGDVPESLDVVGHGGEECTGGACQYFLDT